jgi:katanin p80 WD40 repeat-containing subunit B1
LYAYEKNGLKQRTQQHNSGSDLAYRIIHQEEVVVAGSTSGTIKLWDLDQAKTIRTLVGHRSDCLAVDFHPFGAFFASGSLDTNLKIWDIRRKACIQTYKGHLQGVNVVR